MDNAFQYNTPSTKTMSNPPTTGLNTDPLFQGVAHISITLRVPTSHHEFTQDDIEHLIWNSFIATYSNEEYGNIFIIKKMNTDDHRVFGVLDTPENISYSTH